MNIVFWIIVLLAIAFLWFCCSFLFRGTGSVILDLFRGVENAVSSDDEKESTKESKEKTNNER